MEFFGVIALVLVGLGLFSFVVTVEAAVRTAPFAASPPAVVQQALALVELAPGELVVDLGCGDGRVLVAAGRAGARGVGYELSPHRTALAVLTVRRAGVRDRAKVVWGDLFNADIRDADVAFVWLTPKARALEAKLRSELKPGARVVVRSNPVFPTWKPERTEPVPGGGSLSLYRQN